MYHFSAGEVPQSIIDSVTQLVSLPQKSVSHITENILKYLAGVGGVNKEVMAEAVTEFSTLSGIEVGEAQGLVKVLLNILKASYRGGLTSAQVGEDFNKLSGSAEATKIIVSLWSTYISKSDTGATESPAAEQPKVKPVVVAPKPSIAPRPAAAATPSEVKPVPGVAPSEVIPTPVPAPSESTEPLASLDDLLGGGDGARRAFDELQDITWSFGVTAASSDPARVGSTFVRLALHVRSPAGTSHVRRVQLGVRQFYSLLHQLERARAEARLA